MPIWGPPTQAMHEAGIAVALIFETVSVHRPETEGDAGGFRRHYPPQEKIFLRKPPPSPCRPVNGCLQQHLLPRTAPTRMFSTPRRRGIMCGSRRPKSPEAVTIRSAARHPATPCWRRENAANTHRTGVAVGSVVLHPLLSGRALQSRLDYCGRSASPTATRPSSPWGQRTMKSSPTIRCTSSAFLRRSGIGPTCNRGRSTPGQGLGGTPSPSASG